MSPARSTILALLGDEIARWFPHGPLASGMLPSRALTLATKDEQRTIRNCLKRLRRSRRCSG